MRRLLPLLVLALVGCSREPAPAPKPVTGVPQGELATPQELAQKADVPLYPDAKTPEKRSNIRRDGAEIRYELIQITKDTPAKVLAFYKEKLPKGQQVGEQWMGMTPKGHFASVSATPEGGATMISVVVRSTEK
ncbi:MAG: hypothetical protein ACO1SV_26795 [Fimbriimonas sp.]